MPNLIYGLLILLSLVIGFMAFSYVCLAKRTAHQHKGKLKQFGINSIGTSMDKRNIFVVPPHDIGM